MRQITTRFLLFCTVLLFIFASTSFANAMDVSDCVLDYNKLQGKEVEVTGYLWAAGEYTYIYDKPTGATYLMVETAELPREIRKKIMTKCTSQKCKTTLTGIVEDVYYSKGIKATSLR